MTVEARYVLSGPEHQALMKMVQGLIQDRVESQEALRHQRQQDSTRFESLCLELLEVVDLLDGQVDHFNQRTDEGPWRRVARNLEVTRNKMLAALAIRGLTPIGTAVGDTPDYATSKCVERQFDATLAAPVVVQVVRPGYRIANRVLRSADVVVATPEAGDPAP